MRIAILISVIGLTLVGSDLFGQEPQEWQTVGRLHAGAMVEIKSRLAGYVTEVNVNAGDAVSKGDLLAEIDPRQYELELEAARARLQAAEARLESARIRADNAKRMVEKNLADEAQLKLEETKVVEAESAVRLAQIEATQAELRLSFTRIVAPMDGVVGQINVTPGDLVGNDPSSLMTIVMTDRLKLSFVMPQDILLRLRRDGLANADRLQIRVGISGEDDLQHMARLSMIETEIDPRSLTAKFWATLPNPNGLLSPGMRMEVRLRTTEAQ